jgi:hypothetical protein
MSDPTPRPVVVLDPDSPSDCAALGDTLFGVTRIDIDLGAIAEALRALRTLREHPTATPSTSPPCSPTS